MLIKSRLEYDLDRILAEPRLDRISLKIDRNQTKPQENVILCLDIFNITLVSFVALFRPSN